MTMIGTYKVSLLFLLGLASYNPSRGRVLGQTDHRGPGAQTVRPSPHRQLQEQQVG